MRCDVRVLAASEKGACCLRTTASSTLEGFWLPRANCQWSGDVREGNAVTVEVPDWLASRHRQLVGDEAFVQSKAKEGNQAMSNDYPPSFRLTRMYRKKSATGATYFSGRLGGAKVVLVKSKETAEDGTEIWSLLASEAPQKQQDTRPGPRENSQRDFARPSNGGSPGAF